jgi:hypothetical protein
MLLTWLPPPVAPRSTLLLLLLPLPLLLRREATAGEDTCSNGTQMRTYSWCGRVAARRSEA